MTSSFYPRLYFCYHSSISGVFGVLNIMASLAILVGVVFKRLVWISLVFYIVSFITNSDILVLSPGEEL